MGKKPVKGQIRLVMVETKSVVAHIHEWEEERVWESGDGGGEY